MFNRLRAQLQGQQNESRTSTTPSQNEGRQEESPSTAIPAKEPRRNNHSNDSDAEAKSSVDFVRVDNQLYAFSDLPEDIIHLLQDLQKADNQIRIYTEKHHLLAVGYQQLSTLLRHGLQNTPSIVATPNTNLKSQSEGGQWKAKLSKD